MLKILTAAALAVTATLLFKAYSAHTRQRRALWLLRLVERAHNEDRMRREGCR